MGLLKIKMTMVNPVKSLCRVATDPKKNTVIKYKLVVATFAAKVPMGIERWVSFSEAERLEPAMIPVTAGKNRPTNALKTDEH
nr:hypothetical protein Itr_chr06CG19480 [Ipomoea trifida]